MFVDSASRLHQPYGAPEKMRIRYAYSGKALRGQYGVFHVFSGQITDWSPFCEAPSVSTGRQHWSMTSGSLPMVYSIGGAHRCHYCPSLHLASGDGTSDPHVFFLKLRLKSRTRLPQASR